MTPTNDAKKPASTRPQTEDTIETEIRVTIGLPPFMGIEIARTFITSVERADEPPTDR